MTPIKVIKKDKIEQEFKIEKIRKKIDKAIKNTSISNIEVESKLNFSAKKVWKTTEINAYIINTLAKEITLNTPDYDLIVGRIAMDNLYKEVWKQIKLDVYDFEDVIYYLVRNGYYRKDVLDFLQKISAKTKEKVKEYIKNENYDFELKYAQVEILKSKYLIKNKKGVIEYPIISDLINALIVTEGDEKYFFEFFKLLNQQYISLATPFKANLRKPNGNAGSCFIGENEDSLVGIAKSWTDIAIISKNGGGIGWYLGKIRPSNTYTPKVVKANLVNKWVKILNDIIIAVNQGGTRKGAITVALNWWHYDFDQFLEIKTEEGDLRDKCFDVFPQVVVDNWFMKKVKNKEEIYHFNHYEYKKLTKVDITELIGDELYKHLDNAMELCKQGKITCKKIKANELWKQILWNWVKIGDMYITNVDNLNKSNYLKDFGITKCSNLCVTGDTKILTKEYGDIEIGKLIEEMKINKATCWNGEEWSETELFRTDDGNGQEVMEVVLDNGVSIKATPYHKWYILVNGKVQKVRTYQLKEGCVIQSSNGKWNVKIKEIKIIEGKYPTYCGTEPKRNKLTFNGVVTGNCVESFSLSKVPTEWKEEVKNEERVTTETNGLYHSCSLISVNFAKDDILDKLEKVVFYSVYALDKSIDSGKMPVKEAENSAKLLRNIGVGTVGIADLMAKNKKGLDKEEDLEWIEAIFEKFSYYSYKASIKLAKEYGAYPLFDKANYDKLFGYTPKELNKISKNNIDWVELQKEIKENGIRNFLINAIAPNSSTGILMGASASYLPVYSKYNYQTLGELSLPIIPKYIKDRYWYYKTRFQYHPKQIIEYTRRIQRWIDTGISMEINIDPTFVKINEVSDAIVDGFLSGELKAVYYSLTKDKENVTKETSCADCAN